MILKNLNIKLINNILSKMREFLIFLYSCSSSHFILHIILLLHHVFNVIARYIIASNHFVSHKLCCCAIIMSVISQNILLLQVILFQVLASHVAVLSWCLYNFTKYIVASNHHVFSSYLIFSSWSVACKLCCCIIMSA